MPSMSSATKLYCQLIDYLESIIEPNMGQGVTLGSQGWEPLAWGPCLCPTLRV